MPTGPSPTEQATLIVRGTAVVTPGYPDASIVVTTVLKGAAAWGVRLDGAQGLTDQAEAIYYLVPGRADHWRVAVADPVDREDAIIGELAGVRAPEPPASLTTSLATFREAPAWQEHNEPAMRAARDILATSSFIGMTRARVEAALGPGERFEEGRLYYMRHNGEIGASFAFRIAGDRVVAVELYRTQ